MLVAHMRPGFLQLGDQKHEIAEIVDMWQDHSFGLTEPLRKNRRLRRYRNSPGPSTLSWFWTSG
jgi:hypothetical protein